MPFAWRTEEEEKTKKKEVKKIAGAKEVRAKKILKNPYAGTNLC